MICCRRRGWNPTNTVPMVDNDTSSKIGVESFNKLLTSGTEFTFLNIAKWQLYTCRPTNILWVSIEIIDPLVPKDISRRGGLWSLPFSNRWVSVSQMTVERGGLETKSAVYHYLFPRVGFAGFPGLRRLNNRQQTTNNNRQIGARNVAFQKSSHFSKISETVTAILLTKIDESSKLLRWVPRWDGHPVGVLEMSLLNRFGRRTERRADGTRSSNCYLSKIFTPLEIFSNSNAFQ